MKTIVKHGTILDCVICYKEFPVRVNNQKTCSKQCSHELKKIRNKHFQKNKRQKINSQLLPKKTEYTKCLWCDKDIKILSGPVKYCRDNWKCKANHSKYNRGIKELKDIRPILYASHFNIEIKCKAFDRCKNYYIPRKGNHQFCSPECNLIYRGRKYIHQKFCAICNTEIPRTRTYCSDKCLKESRNKGKVYREIPCVHCKTNTFRSADPRAMYCTDYCRSRAAYERNRNLIKPHKKKCIICKVPFVTKKPNQTICLAYDCKTARYNMKYKNYKTSNRDNYKEKDGYLYCMYHKKYNIYKVGITYKPSPRVRYLERCGFPFKLLYEFPTKHDARLAEREFYIDAESMAISPGRNDKENNRFYDPIFKSYAGKTEIIYGEMIKYYELKKMLDSLMGKEISQTHKRLTHPV